MFRKRKVVVSLDPTIVVALIVTILGSGGILGGIGWLFRNQSIKADVQVSHITSECDKRVAELKDRLVQKAAECDEERLGRERADGKYVELLKADIEERKTRDRAIELLSKAAASRNDTNPFQGDN